mgnify:CR=1 FL=1
MGVTDPYQPPVLPSCFLGSYECVRRDNNGDCRQWECVVKSIAPTPPTDQQVTYPGGGSGVNHSPPLEDPLPYADFIYQLSIDLMVTFITFGNALRYAWKFGDGYSSFQKNPTHFYSKPGTYTVILWAFNKSGNYSSTSQQIVVVHLSSKSDFSYVAVGLAVQFTDTSTIKSNSWLWDFGDGKTSTLQSPYHLYAEPGVYAVTLQVRELTSTQHITADLIQGDPEPPVFESSFDYLGDLPYPRYPKPIIDVYQDKIYVVGNYSNYVAIYDTDGNFESKFTIGGDSWWISIDIKVANDEIYVFVVGYGNAALMVYDLTGNYLRTIGAYGGATRSTPGSYYNNCNIAISPTHIFIMDGNNPPNIDYHPLLKYTLSGSYVGSYGSFGTGEGQIDFNGGDGGGGAVDYYDGNLYMTADGNIEVYNANWSFLSTLCSAWASAIAVDETGVYVALNDIFSILFDLNGNFLFNIDGGLGWDDGIATDEENIYIASHKGGTTWSSSIRKFTKVFAALNLEEITAFFTYTPVAGEIPLEVVFTDASNGSPTSWLWQFPDGTTSTLQNPTFQFTTPGLFAVRLTAANEIDSDSIIQYVFAYEEIIDPGVGPIFSLDECYSGICYYQIDAANNQICLYDVNGDLIGCFGSLGTGDGEFNAPTWMVITQGLQCEHVALAATSTILFNIYIVDSGNNRIQAFNYDGVFQFEFGSDILDAPYGITSDGEWLYVTDTGHKRIAVFDLSGNYLFSFGTGYLDTPMGIASDCQYIYITDSTGKIYVFSRFGEYVTVWEGFNTPQDIRVDEGFIYIDNSGDDTVIIYPKNYVDPTAAEGVLTLINNINGEEFPDILVTTNITNAEPWDLVIPVSINIKEPFKDIDVGIDVIPDAKTEYDKNPQKPSGETS